MKDKGTRFSLEYLKILEERLNIEWEAGVPIFLPSRVNEFSIQRLKNELDELFIDELRNQEALVSVGSTGKEFIQSVAFGLCPDFDKLIKVGFLSSDRVILWDLIWSRGMLDQNLSQDMLMTLGIFSCQALMLKGIVDAGGLVFLPPPVAWSDKARFELAKIQNSKHSSVENVGLIGALAVCDDLKIHPYTVFEGEWPERPKHPEGLANHEMFSEKHYAFHNAMVDLVSDQRFEFLENIKATDFYNIISGENKFRCALKEQFRSALTEGSRIEASKTAQRIRDSLETIMTEQNKKVRNYSLATGGAAISSVATLGTLLSSGVLNQGSAAATLAIGGMSGSLLSLLATTLQKSKRNVLVKTFVSLKNAPRYEAKEDAAQGQMLTN